MPFALILLAASFIPGNLKRLTAHPMLWSITLWALVHLLANGDLAGLLLFGGFGAIMTGLVAYALLLKFHGSLFGVAVWY